MVRAQLPRPRGSVLGLLATLAFVAPSAPAGAATFMHEDGLGTTVPDICTTSGRPTLAFENYSGDQRDFTTSFSVSCTVTTVFSVGLDAGSAAGATVTSRRMTGLDHDTLSYQLFQDAARTVNWGDHAGIDTMSGIGRGLTVKQSFTVYGRAPGGQPPSPRDTYSDMITVTVSY